MMSKRYHIDKAIEFVIAAANYRHNILMPPNANIMTAQYQYQHQHQHHIVVPNAVVIAQAKRIVDSLQFGVVNFIDDATHSALLNNLDHANADYFDDAVGAIVEFVAVTHREYWHEAAHLFLVAI